MRIIARDGVLRWSVISNTYLWFLAALLQFVIVVYGHDALHVNETEISYLQAAVGIGIGIGSVVAGYLSRGRIDHRLVPLGAMGMTLFGFLVSQSGLGIWAVRFDLCFLGIFGGFFAVPVNALIQHRPAPKLKGGVIAAANLLSFVGVFAAAGIYFLLSSTAHLQPGQIFLAGAIMTVAATLYAFFGSRSMREIGDRLRRAEKLKHRKLHVQEFFRVLAEVTHQQPHVSRQPGKIVIQFRIVKKFADGVLVGIHLGGGVERFSPACLYCAKSESSVASLPRVPLPARMSSKNALLFSTSFFVLS